MINNSSAFPFSHNPTFNEVLKIKLSILRIYFLFKTEQLNDPLIEQKLK